MTQCKSQTQTLGRPVDPFLSAFRDPSPGFSPHSQDAPASAWSVAASRPSRAPPDVDPASMRFPAFSQSFPAPEVESSVWNCKHIPPEDPFLAAFERTVTQETLNLSDAWTRPPPRPAQESGRGAEVRGDPFSVNLVDTKTPPNGSSSSTTSSSSNRKDRDRKRDRSLPPPVTSDDPFAITMIGSPTHQSSLAAAAGMIPAHGNSGGGASNSNRLDAASAPGSGSAPAVQPKKELIHWNSVHNPFSEGAAGAPNSSKTQEERGGERRKHRSSESEPRRNAPPLTRHSGPQEDLCFSTDKDQDCLDLNAHIPCTTGSHKGNDIPSSQTCTKHSNKIVT